MSIGVRFVELQKALGPVTIREEFLGFILLQKIDSATIAGAIIKRTKYFGLNLDKLCGQGYDGCSVMAGK